MRYSLPYLCVTMLLLSNISLLQADTMDFDNLLKVIENKRVQHNVAGAAVTIVDADTTLHTAYLGLADRHTKTPVDENTVFRVGSITKTFTSLAILRLVEQGKIDLDAEVKPYLPEVAYSNTYADQPIRLAHLLEHTAGFHDMDAHEWNFQEENWTLLQSFRYSPSSRITSWEPGHHSSYTNSGAGIAAYVAEEITGEKFEDFVRKEIFNPLGFSDATFFPDEHIKQRLATGYNTDGKSEITYWHMLYRPFGAMNMSVSEMATTLRFLINKGRTDDGREIFSKQSIERLEKPATTLAARDGLTYGYGLGNYTWIRNGVIFHGHGGDADGYLAHYGYSRANNKGYFLVINAFNGRALRSMRRSVEEWLTAGLEKAAPPARFNLSSEQLQDITGTYQVITKRFTHQNDDTLQVYLEGDDLYTKLNSDRPKKLIPVNERHFRRDKDPVATIAIVKNASQVNVLQGDIGNFEKIN